MRHATCSRSSTSGAGLIHQVVELTSPFEASFRKMTDHVMHQLMAREAGKRKRRGHDHFPFHRKRVKRAFARMDVDGDGKDDRHDKSQAHMIPGVDGKLIWGFPQRIMTRLRYVDEFTLTSTSGGIATNVFRMNGAFDPDFTNGGSNHQPMFFDTWAGIYSRYRVHASRLRVRFTPNPTSDTGLIGPYIVGINGRNSTTALSAVARTRMEASDAVYKVINRQTGPTELDWVFEPELKLGTPLEDDVNSAIVTGNPSQVYLAHVWAKDSTGPITSLIPIVVEIEYLIEFYQLNESVES